MLTWDDREIATAWDLIDKADKRAKAESRGRRPSRAPRDPGAGGPIYSG